MTGESAGKAEQIKQEENEKQLEPKRGAMEKELITEKGEHTGKPKIIQKT